MGWSQRGNGYTYDSLNGYACIIGLYTKMVLDFTTLNHKCKQCEINPTTYHPDCRVIMVVPKGWKLKQL